MCSHKNASGTSNVDLPRDRTGTNLLPPLRAGSAYAEDMLAVNMFSSWGSMPTIEEGARTNLSAAVDITIR